MLTGCNLESTTSSETKSGTVADGYSLLIYISGNRVGYYSTNEYDRVSFNIGGNKADVTYVYVPSYGETAEHEMHDYYYANDNSISYALIDNR